MKKEHECGDNCDCGHECDDECDCSAQPTEDEQRRYIEQQIMQQQLMEMENQLTQIEAKKQELQIVVDSIDSLDGNENADIMVPLGTGVLVKGKLSDSKQFLVNIGANIVVFKTAKETKELVNSQIKELEKARELFENEIRKVITH